MPHKYEQDMKDRKDESRGMKGKDGSHKMRRYEKDMMDSSYYGMISEDHSAPANMPQEVVHKYYRKNDYFNSHELDDSIRGIDDTRNDTIRQMERYESDVKI